MTITGNYLKYKTIYADPPWPESGGGKIKRGADRHYPLMKVKDIIVLPVAELADENCHLYSITWVKDRMGLGQYFRGMTEHCLFGVKGRLPYKIEGGKRQQGRTAIQEAKTIHSRKPEKMRRMIETVSYAPRIELFARERAEGWDSWGNELKQTVPWG